MIFKDNQISDLRIAYIGGGSRGWAWTFMTDLARQTDLSGTVALYDIDFEAAKKNEKIGNDLSAREDAPGKFVYRAAETLKDALNKADFVIISILPGTFDEMEADVHMPERLGIYQSVGDTAGPGGHIRALRTIPMFVTIAQAVRDFAPDAWVINYTNPMSLCVKTLYTIFPQIKAFGCCHEVFGTQRVLAEVVRREYGLETVDRKDIHVNVKGINHFTWFDEASWKGIDLFPLYARFVEQHFEEGIQVGEKNWMNDHFACRHRVKFDLFRRYGAIAAAGDRHLAEFMPGEMYLKDPDTVKSWNFSLTPVSWRKADLQERLRRSDRLYRGEEAIELAPTGEEGTALIRALCGLDRLISNVNIPNSALQIPDLPADAVVETNAVFSCGHIHPLYAGPLGDRLLPLVRPHVINHSRILRAALTCDIVPVLEAFKDDPLVKGRAWDEQIRQLADDMIQATCTYLPEGWH